MSRMSPDSGAREVRDPPPALRLAPLPVTPTKPLTLSHVKGLLWLDVLERATRLVRPVEYDANRTTYDVTWQTVDFWHWLDCNGIDCTRFDDIDVGLKYVEFHAQRAMGPRAGAEELRAEVELGYLHPSAARVLEVWSRQYQALGLRAADLTRSHPIPRSPAQAIAALARGGLVLDQRALGGSVFLDLTDQGLPLRTLVDETGRDNHLLCSLRALVGERTNDVEVALLCDAELRPDYLLLERCLQRLGARVFTLALGRVRMPDGSAGSARMGGWQDHTVDRLVERFPSFAPDVFRLGIRLYFVAALGAGAGTPLRYPLLQRFLTKAQRLLETPAQASREAGLQRLRELARPRGFVDPYRVTSALLAPALRGELRPLVEELFT